MGKREEDVKWLRSESVIRQTRRQKNIILVLNSTHGDMENAQIKLPLGINDER